MTPLPNKPSPVQSCAGESGATGSSDEGEYTAEKWQQRISATRMRLINRRQTVQSQETQLMTGKAKVEANKVKSQRLQQQLELLITGRTMVG